LLFGLGLAADVVIDEVLESIAAARNRAPIASHEAQRLIGFFDDAEAAFVQLLW
jgi:hypothetical protein